MDLDGGLGDVVLGVLGIVMMKWEHGVEIFFNARNLYVLDFKSMLDD